MTDEQPHSEPEPVYTDLYLKLADRASQRFESRRSMEWTTNVGLWTLLAGASALVVSMPWEPSSALAIVVFVLAAGVWYVHSFVWLRYLAESFERESKTAYFWERAAIKTGSRFDVPASLLPGKGSERTGNWPEPGETDGEKNYLTDQPWNPLKVFRMYHTAQKCQVLLTLGLVLLLGGFLWSASQRDSGEGLSIEGLKLEASKVEGTRARIE